MTEAIKGTGVLLVRARIAESAKEILDENTLLRWYDDEHMPEVVSTSGIRSGFRCIDSNKTSPLGDSSNPTPYLSFYPIDDMAFLLSEEFRKVKVQSDILPGTGIVYDLAEFDISYLGLHTATETKRPVKYILTCGARPVESVPSSELESFLANQIAQLSEAPDYMRSRIYKLQYARTNAESRKLKGLPAEEAPSAEPSTWLAIHEFEAKPGPDLMKEVTEGFRYLEQKIGEAKAEAFVWTVHKIHGDGKMFN